MLTLFLKNGHSKNAFTAHRTGSFILILVSFPQNDKRMAEMSTIVPASVVWDHLYAMTE